ncbi:MAG: hypothetical protein ACK4QW_06605 [Alphaproteobacteria bacterium]
MPDQRENEERLMAAVREFIEGLVAEGVPLEEAKKIAKAQVAFTDQSRRQAVAAKRSAIRRVK